MLKRITCPVLIIHGDADPQELDLLEFSKKALCFLPKGSQLEVIKGASHTFLDHIAQVVELTEKWFRAHFPVR
jgi:pimeloyl-ACP methyl ester carboxylesterase